MKPKLFPFDLAMLFVVATSAVSLVLLTRSAFKPAHALILGVLLTVAVPYALQAKVDWSDERFTPGLVLILLVALFFRWDPYLFVSGGQDEGVYVAMSATYQREGSAFLHDRVRQAITSPAVLAYYDQQNQASLEVSVPGKFEGLHVAGSYIANLQESLYVYQFYPLHPLWMALAAYLLGDGARVYSLVFFGLVSIVAFYLLALELIPASRLPAYALAFLLAVNPLHSFFSKFPVSEVAALAFSAGGFYYLARAYRLGSRGEQVAFYLFLSTAFVAANFFTRISGFLYLPTFFLILVATTAFVEPQTLRLHVIIYTVAIFALYFLSVLYGLRFSFPYSFQIYNAAFVPVFGHSWHGPLAACALLATTPLPVALALKRYRGASLRHAASLCAAALPILFLAVLAIGVYEAYDLAYTTRYVGDPLVDRAYHLANRGWVSLQASSLGVLAAHLSPPLLLLSPFVFVSIARTREPELIVLGASIIFFWAYGIIFQHPVLYQYYFARYYVSEIVPYMLLAECTYLGKLAARGVEARLVLVLLLIITGGYYLYFTRFQLAGREAEGADTALKAIAQRVDGDDLLLVNSKEFRYRSGISPALADYYGLNVMTMADPSDLGRLREFIATKFNDVFVLTQVPLFGPGFDLLDTRVYRQGVFEHSPWIPRKFWYLDATLYLYRLQKQFGAAAGSG